MLLDPYNPKWEEDFKLIKVTLNEALLGCSFTIEHVGSTAVPELVAKPIIDVDVVYYSPTNFNEIRSRLEQIGYYHNGNQGIVGREVFKRKELSKHKVLDHISHHLYVCSENSEELQKHILFRDYLRKNPRSREQYAKMKLKIATEANQQKKRYAILKTIQLTKFIHDIVKKESE